MLALLGTILRRKIRLQAVIVVVANAVNHAIKTALDRFWGIPYLSASRRSDWRGDQVFPGILAVHKTNSYAVSTRGWVCIGDRLAALGRIDSADQRSGFGSKDAADRFDTFGGARCNVNQLMRSHTRASRTARSAILFPTARASKPTGPRRNCLPHRPIAPGNSWSPLPPWDLAFPGAFLRADGKNHGGTEGTEQQEEIDR
jgi:hypothetical protein